MKRLSEEELDYKPGLVRRDVKIGGIYTHYKKNDYKVLDVAILESNNVVCIVYEAMYGKHLRFIRTAENWLEDVEIDGKFVRRFSSSE